MEEASTGSDIGIGEDADAAFDSSLGGGQEAGDEVTLGEGDQAAEDTGPPGEAGPDADRGLEQETSTALDAREDGDAEAGWTDGPLPVPIDHRPDDSQCAAPRPPGNCQSNGVGPLNSCSSDSQCVDGGANGRCLAPGGPPGCFCSYDACRSDTDCAAGQACVCHGSAYAGGGNVCMAGNCRVDSDCGNGGSCSPAHLCAAAVGVGIGYYCHTNEDQCVNDSDCSMRDVCTWSSVDSRWECRQQVCPL